MKINKDQYMNALSAEGVLKERSIELLTLLYDAPNCQATAPQLANMLGYKDFQPVNALIGKLGKRIANHLGIELPERDSNSPGWWKVIADGEPLPEGFTWHLHGELLDALIELGLLQDSDTNLYPEVITPDLNLSEGQIKLTYVNTFERNSVARKQCIEHYGALCSICDFDFSKKYGDMGVGFIHVHHLVELSSIGKQYKVDPITDLRPVCPNCHAMLHKRSPPYSIDELKTIMSQIADSN